MRNRVARLLLLGGLSAAVVLAQRGGGGRSGAGPRVSAPAMGAVRSNPAPARSSIGLSPITAYHSPTVIGPSVNLGRSAGSSYPGRSRWNGGRGNYGRGYRYGRGSGFALGYPFGYLPISGYYSYLGEPFYNDYSSFGYPTSWQGAGYNAPPDDPSMGPDPAGPGPGPASGDPALGEQLAQLNEQVNDLRARLGQTEGMSGAPPVTAAPQPAPAAPSAPPVTVILTSGQNLQVQNYAVVGDTFWDFSSQPVRKIPVSSIDLAASIKATEANGAEFPKVASPAR